MKREPGTSTTNSEMGSDHWRNTLLARIKHIGEALRKPDLLVNEQTTMLWGESLYDASNELLDGFAITTTDNSDKGAEMMRKRIGQIVLGTAEDGESPFTIYDNDSVLDDIMDIVIEFANQSKVTVNQSELHNEITNVHEAMEGRYELDGSDLYNIHALLCKLQFSSQQRVVTDEEIAEMCHNSKIINDSLNYTEGYRAGFIKGAEAVRNKLTP
jgi:hypothetical protein